MAASKVGPVVVQYDQSIIDQLACLNKGHCHVLYKVLTKVLCSRAEGRVNLCCRVKSFL